jgi:hypothetical protein
MSLANASASALLLALAACQSAEPARYAVLERADEASIAQIKSALAAMMGTATIALGPSDPTQSSNISVLPRPLGPHDDRSTALPTQFDLMLRGTDCILVRRGTHDERALPGVACRAL